MKTLAMVVLSAVCAIGCSSEKAPDKPSGDGGAAHAHKGTHGGQVLEIGAHVAHLEVVHDEAGGTMTLYVLGKDAKTPLEATKPPEIKLSTDAGPEVLATTAKAGAKGVYQATHEVLKGHGPTGRITVEIDGKVYNPELEHADH